MSHQQNSNRGFFSKSKLYVSEEFLVGNSTNGLGINSTGVLSLSGNARVQKIVDIDATDLQVPGANPADQKDHGISTVYGFDKNTQEYLTGSIHLREDMDRSVEPEIHADWSSSATSGGARWQFEYLYISPGDNSTAVAQATLAGTSNPNSTAANGLVTLDITGMALPAAADERLLFRISRVVGHADDDMDADADLHGLHFVYTANTLGE